MIDWTSYGPVTAEWTTTDWVRVNPPQPPAPITLAEIAAMLPGKTVADVCRAALLLGYMPRFVFEAQP